MAYDPNNIFAKILQGTIPCQKIYENDHTLAFNDISPKAPIHVLVIPKGPYIDSQDFYTHATSEEIISYTQGIAEIVEQLNIKNQGLRQISNLGTYGGQEVPHFHTHILAGKPLGPLLSE